MTLTEDELVDPPDPAVWEGAMRCGICGHIEVHANHAGALRASPVADTAGTTPLAKLIDAAWGGYTRPDDDAGILLAIADWMDRLDDTADSLAGGPVVHRTMQDDLRRISRAVADTAGIDAARLTINAERRRIREAILAAGMFEGCGGMGCTEERNEELAAILTLLEPSALRTPKPEGETE